MAAGSDNASSLENNWSSWSSSSSSGSSADGRLELLQVDLECALMALESSVTEPEDPSDGLDVIVLKTLFEALETEHLPPRFTVVTTGPDLLRRAGLATNADYAGKLASACVLILTNYDPLRKAVIGAVRDGLRLGLPPNVSTVMVAQPPLSQVLVNVNVNVPPGHGAAANDLDTSGAPPAPKLEKDPKTGLYLYQPLPHDYGAPGSPRYLDEQSGQWYADSCEVIPGRLSIGSIQTARGLDPSIGAIVNLTSEDLDETYQRRGLDPSEEAALDPLQVLQVGISDTPSADLFTALVSALPWMVARFEEGRHILVHCRAGVSRSSSVVLAFLMICGVRLDVARRWLSMVRPKVNPNLGFDWHLQAFEAALFPDTNVAFWGSSTASGSASSSSSYDDEQGAQGAATQGRRRRRVNATIAWHMRVFLGLDWDTLVGNFARAVDSSQIGHFAYGKAVLRACQEDGDLVHDGTPVVLL